MLSRFTTKEKRVGWIDVAKAIAIYLMVLGHTGVSDTVNIIIHSFHMPVFFILSGYCFNEEKNNNLMNFVKKRIFNLIIPYLIFATGLFLFWNFALYILNRPAEMRSIYNLLSSMLWNNANASAFGVIQWFLTCLFFTEIIFFVICKSLKGKLLNIGISLVLLSICAYNFPRVSDFRLPLALDCALMASVFFGIGWLFRKINCERILKYISKHKFFSVICIMGIVCIIIPIIFLNGEVNMRIINYGNYALFLLNAVVSTIILIIVAMLVDVVARENLIARFLKWIGRNTLVVMLLNSTVIRIWQVLSETLIANLNDGFIYIINCFVAIVVVVICAAMSEIINKFFPVLLGKRKL